jgi:GT2 family glycosyltransferase
VRYLADCLESVMNQTYPEVELLVIDNASTDGSRLRLQVQFPEVRLVQNDHNLGYAAALNQALTLTHGEYLLPLNPDVTLAPDFVAQMVAVAESDPTIGSVAPKLLRPPTGGLPNGITTIPNIQYPIPNTQLTIDSTGLFIDRARRTRDRGQGQVDQGQYDEQTEVFAACGAAALYRRAMLADVAVEGEVFDEDFFAYYEDADLGWRARLRGWRCVYTSQTLAFHARGGSDTLRQAFSAPKRRWIQAHALKNRYLMIMKNDLRDDLLRDLPWILRYDIPRLAYAALGAPGALAGLRTAWTLQPLMFHKREFIQARRRASPAEIRAWFLGRVPSASPR